MLDMNTEFGQRVARRLAEERIGMTAEQFGSDYSVAIRITPTKLRGH